MFVILLKFSDNKPQAGRFMQGHKDWIKRGFDDGVFLITGSLQPNLGGGVIAHNTNLTDLQIRVAQDPFVTENIVTSEIIEITASQIDERLHFLTNPAPLA